MRISLKSVVPLLTLVLLGAVKANAESVTLDVQPFKHTSTVDSNIIYELTVQQLEQDGTVTLLTEEDDKDDVHYTASVSLARGPGGFIGNLRIHDTRADTDKSMYVVLMVDRDDLSASAIARSIIKEIRAFEAKRAEEAAEKVEDEEPEPESAADEAAAASEE